MNKHSINPDSSFLNVSRRDDRRDSLYFRTREAYSQTHLPDIDSLLELGTPPAHKWRFRGTSSQGSSGPRARRDLDRQLLQLLVTTKKRRDTDPEDSPGSGKEQ
jgi:hypothetical protein